MLRQTASFRRQSTRIAVRAFTTLGGVDLDLSRVSNEDLNRLLADLGPFPTFSSILNQRHFYQNEVLMQYSKKDPHPVSLRQLAGYGKKLTKQKILASANFVRLELPIRLALRIRDLQTLPFGVVSNFHMAQIYELYYHSFNAFRKIPEVRNLSDNAQFCETLSILLDDHVFNLPHLLMGALEVSILGDLPQQELDHFMLTMIRSRILRRLIVEEHLLLTENYQNHPYTEQPPDFIGSIFHQCKAGEQLTAVGDKIRENIGSGPELVLEGDVDAVFPFMIPHLHYLLGEILRNSFQATIQSHSKENLPPVKITVIDRPEEVVFRILDLGGGIRHHQLHDIWLFGKNPDEARRSLANFHRVPGLQLYHDLKVTEAGSLIVGRPDQGAALLANTSISDEADVGSRLLLDQLASRGQEYKFGLGLPMCRVYTDYWNGSLLMNSLDGFGSDTCLTLRKLGRHTNVNQLDRA